MKVGSLFSGIGGLELGLERSGMEVRWQVEIDPFCLRVLEKHWPDVTRYEDVRDVGSHNLEPVDLICGGFPCQPVSVAGKGLAQSDERWMWPEFARIVRELRPGYVLVENVPGLLGRGMGDVLRDLATIGYDAEWESIPAAAVGAPHLRYRIFIVAYPDSERGRASAFSFQGLCDPPELGDDGKAKTLAHATSSRFEEGGCDTGGPVRNEARWSEPQRRGNEVADTRSGDVERNGATREQESTIRQSDVPTEGRQSLVSGWGHWATEPAVDRVANGVPARVDRIKALGNAVVPQVAEWIGQRIMAVA